MIDQSRSMDDRGDSKGLSGVCRGLCVVIRDLSKVVRGLCVVIRGLAGVVRSLCEAVVERVVVIVFYTGLLRNSPWPEMILFPVPVLRRIRCMITGKMSRLGQTLIVIFLLCLFINGVFFMLRYNGYNPFVVIPDLSLQPKVIQTLRTLQQVSDNDSVAMSSNLTIVNPHDYTLLINHPELCADRPELLIVVCSSIANDKIRTVIRQTWGSYANDPKHKTKLIFLFGSTDDKNLTSSLKDENKKYGDIIQEDFLDSYRNLSLKSTAMLKWVTVFCRSAMYLLKVDDDMYINVPNLVTSLRQQSIEKFIMGMSFTGARPIQNKKSKWYTPKQQFNEKVYPRYSSGTAYSMSVKAVPDLYLATLGIVSFWLEDIYITGLCARKAGIKLIHNGMFTFSKRKADGCAFKGNISGHKYTAAEMYKIHKELYSNPPQKC